MFTNHNSANTELDTKYLIFDFDGVIGDTYDLMLETMMEVLNIQSPQAKKLIEQFSYTNIRTNSSAETKKLDLKQVGKIFTEKLISQGYLFHGLIKEISKLSNLRLAIVTSGWPIGVHKMLEQAPDLVFDYVLTSQDSPSKIINVKQILSNWQVDSDKVIYFADTVSDISELGEIFANQNMIGCSWGYHGLDILKTVLPDSQILVEPEDFARLFIKKADFKYIQEAIA